MQRLRRPQSAQRARAAAVPVSWHTPFEWPPKGWALDGPQVLPASFRLLCPFQHAAQAAWHGLA